MRRFTIGSAIVLALLLMLAAVAVAAPSFCDPDSPRFDPDNKLCATTTTSDTTSTTTTTVPEPPLQSCEKLPTLSGPGYVDFGCDWTPTDREVSEGVVALTVTGGEASYLAVFVRDSSPGNICVWKKWDKATGHDFTVTFPLVRGDDTYWNTGGEEWCAPYDEFGPKEDLNGEPLTLRVVVRAKRTTTVQIVLDPVQKLATP